MERINEQEIYNFYSRKNRWLGLIDYKSLLVIIVYIFLVSKVIISLKIYSIYKAYLIINLILPIIIFTIFNIREESIIDKLIVIILFYLNRKIYIKMRYYAKLNTKYAKNVDK